MYRILLCCFSASLLTASTVLAQLSGTKTIPGDYATITAAIVDIQTQGLSGALVLELGGSYTSAGETFPLTFTNLTGVSATNTLTLRPATGATSLAVTSAGAAATVNLDNAKYLTIDGRPGGTGTTKQLTIENTNTSGIAIQFVNEASNNTIKYAVVKGVNTSATSGVIFFSTTTGTTGNDNNLIDSCDVRDGASTPVNCIYSLGTTTTTAQFNSNNTISNCNIFNFYSSAFITTGILLDAGSSDWTIMGNSFYQTASRAAVAGYIIPIYLGTATGNNFKVAANFIGGSAPNAAGTAWTTTGGAGYLFIGIQVLVGTTTPSSVQGNTVKNIVWNTSATTATPPPGIWSGINVNSGSANIGTTTGNTIGSGTGTGSVSITTSGTGGTTFGISSTSSGTVAISNNTIGSITTNGSATTVSASLIGIQVTAGTNTISSNTVGSTTTALSLNATTSSTSATGQAMTGIQSSSTTGATITNNTVANLNNNYAGTNTAGQIRGIVTSAGVNTITGNTVRNLSTTSASTNATTSQSVFGIFVSSTSEGQTVSQNTVHSLANTAATANVSVTGIYFGGPTSGTNLIARNFVHSLAVSSSFQSRVNGMHFGNSAFTAQNNLVRVGLKADGTSTAGVAVIRGIYDSGTTDGRNFYHNSVYIGGTQTSGSNTTYAFDGTGVNVRTYQNNIFVNARSNSGAMSSKHYAARYWGSTPNPTGLTANNNIFLASGTGGVLGSYNNVDCTTLTVWQTATGVDANSLSANPLFVNPTAGTPDLHLLNGTPAEGSGTLVASVTDDFDGQTRSGLTPTDIGADAGNFGTGVYVWTGASSNSWTTTSNWQGSPASPPGSTDNVLIPSTGVQNDAVITSAQTIASLVCQNSTYKVSLSGGDLAVTGTLYMIAGNIACGTNTLTLGTGIANIGTLNYTDGMIIGQFKRWVDGSTSSYQFPVGDIIPGQGLQKQNVNITFTAGPTTGGTLVAQFLPSDPGNAGLPIEVTPPPSQTSVMQTHPAGYWSVVAGDGFSMGSGAYTGQFTAVGFPGLSETYQFILVKRANSGSNWTIEGSASWVGGSGTSMTLQRTGMTSFSEFGVGANTAAPLPVQLSSFTGTVLNNRVKLDWTTASEINNYGFYVQRRAESSTEWSDVPNSFVAGHGTTNTPQHYTFTDNAAFTPAMQYRLKQVDLDGSIHFTELITINSPTSVRETGPIEFALKQNYPNPFNPETNIKFSVEQTGRATLEIYNMLGQKVATLFDDVVEAGFYKTVQFNATNFASGMYLYRLTSGTKSDLKKLVLVK